MEQLESVTRLSKDLVIAAKTLSDEEARYLVDYYYLTQDDRKRANNQVRAMSTPPKDVLPPTLDGVTEFQVDRYGEEASVVTKAKSEPSLMVAWLAEQSTMLENQIKRALDAYTLTNPVGVWARSVVGIGPVIAAGLLAHIDIEKAPTVGHIWSFAGLDPTKTWEKGKIRPWNARLKTLCWKIGESFVKIKGKENGFYGHYYEERKNYRIAKNLAGDYREKALAIAAAKPNHAQVATYKEGRLPDGHIHAQAKRDAVKLFLSHLHGVWYEHHYGKAPPLPYPIAILGHAHMIERPH